MSKWADPTLAREAGTFWPWKLDLLFNICPASSLASSIPNSSLLQACSPVVGAVMDDYFYERALGRNGAAQFYVQQSVVPSATGDDRYHGVVESNPFVGPGNPVSIHAMVMLDASNIDFVI
jgi:hypothetical protein